jgi:hypothetical protein
MAWMRELIPQINAVMFSFVNLQSNAQYVARQVRRILICVTVSLCSIHYTASKQSNLPDAIYIRCPAKLSEIALTHVVQSA